VADFLVAHADTRTADGRQRLVRHRHLRERPIMTGIGPIEVRVPRVRDRLGSADDRIRFNSAILPPYARRSFNRAMVEADSPRRSGRAMQQAPCRHRSDAGISRFPPKELLHKPGSSTTPASPDARGDASVHVTFRPGNSVGAQDINLALNGWPRRSPTDASLLPLRGLARDYSLQVSAAHCETFPTSSVDGSVKLDLFRSTILDRLN
jgi:hypothetical protein